MSKSRFHRDPATGSRWAHTDVYELGIIPVVDGGYRLIVRRLTTTAGVRHALQEPIVAATTARKLSEARAVFAEFVRLGDEGVAEDRLRKAHLTIIEAESAAVLAEYDALVAAAR